MNKRIRELAKQTGYIWHASGDPQIYEFTPEKLEKFAELIVRECIDIAKQVENEKFEVAGSAEPEYRKGINDGRRNAAWGIKNRMKLHFGVEE